MSMDYQKLRDLIVEQISDYASNFAATLRKPVLRFTPLKIASPREVPPDSTGSPPVAN